MIILAFDTSTAKGGVAVAKNDSVLSRVLWERSGSHGEYLTPAIEKCLSDAGFKASQVDAIALGRGPGSFTGARIAVNVAKSLAYSLGEKPIYAFDTLELLARGTDRHLELPLVAMVNAHKNLVYASIFSTKDRRRQSEIEALSIEELANQINVPHFCVGDAYNEFAPLFPPELKTLLVRDSAAADEPLPDVIAQLAFREREQRPTLGWKDLQPLYIRASGAEESLGKVRAKSD